MENSKLFEAFEKDLTSESKGLVLVSDTIDYAQTLQLGMLDAHRDQQYDMGVMALELLNDQPEPMKFQDYVIRTEVSYLPIHTNEQTREAYVLKYGGMRLAGRVGTFALGMFEDRWTLALQLFEAKQLYADSADEHLYKKLPAPLMLPVTAIRPPFFPYSKY